MRTDYTRLLLFKNNKGHDKNYKKQSYALAASIHVQTQARSCIKALFVLGVRAHRVIKNCDRIIRVTRPAT